MRRLSAMLRMGLLATIVAAVLAPAAARADDTPLVITGVSVSGSAVTRATLVASGTWTGPVTDATWAWMRCDASVTVCYEIAGATGPTYIITRPDLGSVLAARLTVTGAGGATTQATSLSTAVVTSPPGGSNPLDTYDPIVITTFDTSRSNPSGAVSGESNPATATPPAISARLRMLSPFPVVRLKGHLTDRGARVSLFSITGPRSVRVTITCKGRGCPVRKLTRRSVPARLKTFERSLDSGIRLEVRVTRPGFIGKSTVFVIQRGKAPRRTDGCLYPGRALPAPCPAT